MVVTVNDRKVHETDLIYDSSKKALKIISEMFKADDYDKVILHSRAVNSIWPGDKNSLETAKLSFFASVFRYKTYTRIDDLTPENHYDNNTCLLEALEFAKLLSHSDNSPMTWKAFQELIEKGFYNPEAFSDIVKVFKNSAVVTKKGIEFRSAGSQAQICSRLKERYPVWFKKYNINNVLQLVEFSS